MHSKEKINPLWNFKNCLMSFKIFCNKLFHYSPTIKRLNAQVEHFNDCPDETLVMEYI